MFHSHESFQLSNTGLSYSSLHLIHLRHQSATGKPSLVNQPHRKPSLIHASAMPNGCFSFPNLSKTGKPVQWNRLPKKVVKSPSWQIFKTHLDTILSSLL